MAHSVYLISSPKIEAVYVGFSGCSKARWSAHKAAASYGSSPLYMAMRAHGKESFSMEVLSEHVDEKEARKAEAAVIMRLTAEGIPILNSVRPLDPEASIQTLRRKHLTVRVRVNSALSVMMDTDRKNLAALIHKWAEDYQSTK